MTGQKDPGVLNDSFGGIKHPGDKSAPWWEDVLPSIEPPYFTLADVTALYQGLSGEISSTQTEIRSLHREVQDRQDNEEHANRAMYTLRGRVANAVGNVTGGWAGRSPERQNFHKRNLQPDTTQNDEQDDGAEFHDSGRWSPAEQIEALKAGNDKSEEVMNAARNIHEGLALKRTVDIVTTRDNEYNMVECTNIRPRLPY